MTAINEEQEGRQRHLEFAVRFLVHSYVPYDGRLDIEEYIDEGIVTLAQAGNILAASTLINQTFQLLNDVAGDNALRRFQNGSYVGRAGLVGLEGIAVGVAKNIESILALGSDRAREFVDEKIKGFWDSPEYLTFTSSGLRGTTRIQRTVQFGEEWFQP